MEQKLIKSLSLGVVLFCLFIWINPANCEEVGYPLEVEIVSKSDARYDSPENAYASMISSLVHRDINWHYESLTSESAQSDIELYNNVSLDSIFDSVGNIKKILFIDSIEYKSGQVLIVELHDFDGSVTKGPSYFIKENGLWKSSTLGDDDEVLLELVEYTPPPQYLTPFTTSIYPSHWPQPWYAWLSEKVETDRWARKQAEQVTFLCVITDGEDDGIELDDIVPESLQFNGTLAPQPWEYFSWRSFSRQSRKVVILPPGEHHPAISRKGFDNWFEHDSPAPRDKTLLLVRFNLYQAMQSLSDLNSGTTHEVFISGKLKDDRLFRVTAEVTLEGPPISQENDSGNRQFLPHDMLPEQWWNR
jgi:hypothetical protein